MIAIALWLLAAIGLVLAGVKLGNTPALTVGSAMVLMLAMIVDF